MTWCIAALFFAAPPAKASAGVELLVLSGDRVSLFTAAVELDGRPFADVWKGIVDAIFADADIDGNGSLDAKEAKRVLSALRVRQLGWGYLWAVPQAVEWAELDSHPADGRVTRDELAAYYRRHGVDGPQVGVGATSAATALTAPLLKLLNPDGRVSEAEWKRAETALRPLDRDDDELIRPGEIVSGTLYPGSAGGVMLVPPTPGKPVPKSLADISLIRLPVEPPVPLPIRPSRFAADANRDGQLDGRELAAVRADRGNVAVTFKLGKRRPGELDAVRAGEQPKGVRSVTYCVATALLDDFKAARKTASEKFPAGDKPILLEALKEIEYAPLRDHFTFADRDGDGRLTRAEWSAYLDLRLKLVEAQVSFTVFDHGPGLFEALDADGDGALSVPELRGAWKHLSSLGCIADGKFDPAKLPVTVRLIASRGRSQSLSCVPPRGGPEWFQAMDRNRDGVVSRREFVGTDDDFRKLDADGDDLITAAEAAGKADR